MATLLDIGLLEYFVPFFVFLLVFVIVFALLEKALFFGKNTSFNLLIALSLAFLFIIVPEITQVVRLITPWFVILLVFLVFLVLMFLFMGVKAERIAEVFGGNEVVFWAIFILSLLIFGYALTQVYGEQIQSITAGESEDGAGNLMQNIGSILFTPKVLGMIFLMVMAGFTVRFVSASVGK